MEKLIVIGLDGGSWNVLRPLIRRGLLPTFKKLLQVGTAKTLYSIIPPVTGGAWVTVATGKNPGKTGIIDFLNRESSDSWELKRVTSKDFRGQVYVVEVEGNVTQLIAYNVLNYATLPLNGSEEDVTKALCKVVVDPPDFCLSYLA